MMILLMFLTLVGCGTILYFVASLTFKLLFAFNAYWHPVDCSPSKYGKWSGKLINVHLLCHVSLSVI